MPRTVLLPKRAIGQITAGGMPDPWIDRLPLGPFSRVPGEHTSRWIRMDYINEAYERMLKSDVKYRFVIDLATLA